MKKIIFTLAFLAFAFPALAEDVDPDTGIRDRAHTYIDVCLSMTGTPAQARAAIQVLGLDKEMLNDEAAPNDPLVSIYNHDVAIDFWENPILVFATFDNDGNEITPSVFAANPIMRIRFISDVAKDKARLNIIDAGGLPAGLEKVDCPVTRVWAWLIIERRPVSHGDDHDQYFHGGLGSEIYQGQAHGQDLGAQQHGGWHFERHRHRVIR